MPQSKKSVQQKEANRLWDAIKRGDKNYDSVMDDIVRKSLQQKSQLMSFWVRSSIPKPLTSTDSSSKAETTITEIVEETVGQQSTDNASTTATVADECTETSTEKAEEIIKPKAEAPKQKSLTSNIAQLNEQLLALFRIRDAGLMTEELKLKMNTIELDIKKKKSQLKRLEGEADRQRKRRSEMKHTLQEITDEMAHLEPKLRKFTRDKVGKPAITVDQPDLLDAIVRIASIGAAASDRRRSEELRSCKTLDDLQKSLVAQGYSLSRSATYLRLLPGKSSSLEGKRHIKTVPVKLI